MFLGTSQRVNLVGDYEKVILGVTVTTWLFFFNVLFDN
jgi:hypothetical protein